MREFRTRLVEGKLELVLLDALLEGLQALALLKRRGKERTDSTQILAAIRTINRLERVGETLHAALIAWGVAAPEWLRTVVDPEWFKLYGVPHRKLHLPKAEAERTQLAAVIGSDGRRLLQAIAISDARKSPGKLDVVTLLEQMWEEQFVEEKGQLRFREVNEMPSPTTLIASPYDHEARFSTNRGESRVGYKVHLIESCDDDLPRLITNIETTPGTTPDDNMIEVVHPSLDNRNLLSSEHLVDKGYTDALVEVTPGSSRSATQPLHIMILQGWSHGLYRSAKPVSEEALMVNKSRSNLISCGANGTTRLVCVACAFFFAGMLFQSRLFRSESVEAASDHLYELMIYHTLPGKAPALESIFREVSKLQANHNLNAVGYWVPKDDDPAWKNTFVYLVVHSDRKSAETNWNALHADPAFQPYFKAAAPLIQQMNGGYRVDEVYMRPTDFSASK